MKRDYENLSGLPEDFHGYYFESAKVRRNVDPIIIYIMKSEMSVRNECKEIYGLRSIYLQTKDCLALLIRMANYHEIIIYTKIIIHKYIII